MLILFTLIWAGEFHSPNEAKFEITFSRAISSNTVTVTVKATELTVPAETTTIDFTLSYKGEGVDTIKLTADAVTVADGAATATITTSVDKTGSSTSFKSNVEYQLTECKAGTESKTIQPVDKITLRTFDAPPLLTITYRNLNFTHITIDAKAELPTASVLNIKLVPEDGDTVECELKSQGTANLHFQGNVSYGAKGSSTVMEIGKYYTPELAGYDFSPANMRVPDPLDFSSWECDFTQMDPALPNGAKDELKLTGSNYAIQWITSEKDVEMLTLTEPGTDDKKEKVHKVVNQKGGAQFYYYKLTGIEITYPYNTAPIKKGTVVTVQLQVGEIKYNPSEVTMLGAKSVGCCFAALMAALAILF
ncbi:hypothetical protein BLNAU_18491 [Blattamonas nauphoetae]|uniref:Uncharacterized protein n=1 Tax=Blattamonas nauphoetae TaxID=2049346 RepID=A0ABQ9X4R4_9EUKA|nr:hypothetical protein BLNAU_18491 [Blattamonas nauphoetae]